MTEANITVTVDLRDVVKRLNTMLEADHDAVWALIRTYHFCNEGLANHPTCQVDASDGRYRVGGLGLLNGALGIAPDGWGPIMARFDVSCISCGAINPGGAVGDTHVGCGGMIRLHHLVGFELSPPWHAAAAEAA